MMTRDGIADLDCWRYTRLFSLLQPHLDEKTKRVVGVAMADSVGRGGQRMVQEITGLSSHTLNRGHDQLTGVELVLKDRIRRVGGGRKLITEIYPGIETALLDLVGESTQGDPESPLLRTNKSLDGLAITRYASLFHSSEPQAVRAGV